MDKKLKSNQYIPPKEWKKIPKNLRDKIRDKEHELGGTDLKNKPVKENKELTKLYANARKFANWSYMGNPK